MSQSVGVIGGTFDPIHTGHLIIAQEAHICLGLDRVVFVPAGQPPHKLDRQITDPEHRFQMVQLATADNPHLDVSRVDLDRAGPCYTVDTIGLLQRAWGGDTRIHFLIGADSLSDLPTWRQPERLLRLCQVVAVARPGHQIDLQALDRLLPGAASLVRLLDTPTLDISSTAIRRRVSQGRSIRYLVPAAVEQYVDQHRLYRSLGNQP
jgi:nicotinate-nucleotide adenylyltransferase